MPLRAIHGARALVRWYRATVLPLLPTLSDGDERVTTDSKPHLERDAVIERIGAEYPEYAEALRVEFANLVEQLEATQGEVIGFREAVEFWRDKALARQAQLEAAREALRGIAEHGACASDARVARAAYGPLYPETFDEYDYRMAGVPDE